jgi:hypothetical protein
MFITVTNKADSTRNEVMIRSIIRFFPSADGQDSIILLANGERLAVNESTRSLRSYIRKFSKVDKEDKTEQTAG